jgi:hypothetical protein
MGSFEIGNTAAVKDPDKLSQTRNAERMRKRHAQEKAAAEADARRAEAAKEAKRVAMIAQFGEERVLAWESLRIAGVVVHDLVNFFFGDWPEKEIITTDENVEETIDLLARALEGCKPDPEMPKTEWDMFRDYAGYARRLGFDLDITPENCREFFGYYLKVRRGEIVRNDFERRSWWPERPVSVQEILAEPPAAEPKPESYATKAPEPAAPRLTISAELHDVLTQLQALRK